MLLQDTPARLQVRVPYQNDMWWKKYYYILSMENSLRIQILYSDNHQQNPVIGMDIFLVQNAIRSPFTIT